MKQRSLFTQVMGNSQETKVLEYFLQWDMFDITATDVAKGARINRNRTYEVIDVFVKKKILVPTRTMGKVKFYELNKKSPIVHSAKKLFKEIIRESLA